MIPSDDIAGIIPAPPTATAATCNGPGKYYRPRACRDFEGAPIACSSGGDAALAQNYAACYTSPGRTAVDGDTITGPLSYLQKGISVNLVVFSDDDISVGGGFSGASTGGRTIVHDMLKQLFQPLGNTVPVYYHSIVGLQSASPAGGVGTIDRVGVNHQQLSILTDGLKADVRSSSYAGVFEQLRKKILFSEQVVSPSCEASSSITPQVYKDGVLLDPSLYTFNVGTKEVRLSPNAFVEGDLDRTIEIEVIY
jgi:hypothetical protein